MKNYILPLLLLLTTALWAQDNNRNEYQQQEFKLAQNLLENHDYLVAIRGFTIAHKINPNSETAQIALKKADSIKTILRKDKINSLIGNWKWISKDANWAMPGDGLVAKMITITADEILFFGLYRNSKKWELAKTEKINFSENPESYSFADILYSNNEVWDYNINKDSGELTAFYIGEKIGDNYTQLVCGNLVFYYFKLQ
ncbi:hypothetical protein QO200_09655 [Flavobacterium sp. Arc3]|uniref:hypothetical protein n=1 Tax=unclassified Flavobacterium TaxID=196869 RepID=UPI00352C68FA